MAKWLINDNVVPVKKNFESYISFTPFDIRNIIFCI